MVSSDPALPWPDLVLPPAAAPLGPDQQRRGRAAASATSLGQRVGAATRTQSVRKEGGAGGARMEVIVAMARVPGGGEAGAARLVPPSRGVAGSIGMRRWPVAVVSDAVGTFPWWLAAGSVIAMDGGLGLIAEWTMRLATILLVRMVVWVWTGNHWRKPRQAVGRLHNGGAFWRRSPPWRRCYGVDPSPFLIVLWVKTLFRIPDERWRRPRRVFLGGTALEKPPRIGCYVGLCIGFEAF